MRYFLIIFFGLPLMLGVFATFLTLTPENIDFAVVTSLIITILICFLYGSKKNRKITLTSPYIKTNKDIVLDPGERILFAVENIELNEEQIARKHQGFSFRLARGLWYRTGKTENSSTNRLTKVDSGDFILTTKKIVFYGNKKIVSCDRGKILALEAFTGGFSFASNSNKKVQFLLGFDKYIISNGDSKQVCDGTYIRDLIRP